MLSVEPGGDMERLGRMPGVRSWLVVAGGLLVVAAILWSSGDTDVATLELDENEGKPGTTIEVHGSGFATRQAAQPVTIRWNDADGEVLATSKPDDVGRIDTAVTIPDEAEPGHHIVMAVQTITDNDEASRAFSTPARATFRVVSDPRSESPSTSGSVGPRRGRATPDTNKASDTDRRTTPTNVHALTKDGGLARQHPHDPPPTPMARPTSSARWCSELGLRATSWRCTPPQASCLRCRRPRYQSTGRYAKPATALRSPPAI